MRSYVVPIDFSKSSNLALDYAIARARRRNAKLILVHVLANNSFAAATSEDSSSVELVIKAQEFARESARNQMRKLVASKGLAPKEHQVVFPEGLDAAAAIAAQARKSRARMIIMGSEGRTGLQRLLSGSVAEATLRATRRPLLIVKRGRLIKPAGKKILVPVDFSKVSDLALKGAKEIAKTEKETLVLLSVATEPDVMVPFYLRDEHHLSLLKEGRERIKQLARRMRIPPSQYQSVVVRSRDAATAIAQEAKKKRVSMIVMGSHGRTGLQHLIAGSVAEKTLRQAPCPVLIYKK